MIEKTSCNNTEDNSQPLTSMESINRAIALGAVKRRQKDIFQMIKEDEEVSVSGRQRSNTEVLISKINETSKQARELKHEYDGIDKEACEIKKQIEEKVNQIESIKEVIQVTFDEKSITEDKSKSMKIFVGALYKYCGSFFHKRLPATQIIHLAHGLSIKWRSYVEEGTWLATAQHYVINYNPFSYFANSKQKYFDPVLREGVENLQDKLGAAAEEVCRETFSNKS